MAVTQAMAVMQILRAGETEGTVCKQRSKDFKPVRSCKLCKGSGTMKLCRHCGGTGLREGKRCEKCEAGVEAPISEAKRVPA